MSDFDFYRLYKTLHVLGVTMLAAGVGIEMVAGPMLARLRTVQEVRVLARMMVIAETFIILPAILIVMGFGYATAGRLNIDLNTTWLVISQVLFFIAVGVSMMFLRRAAKKLQRTAEAAPDGPIPADMAAMMKDPLPGIAGMVLTIFFVIIVYLMVAKPQF